MGIIIDREGKSIHQKNYMFKMLMVVISWILFSLFSHMDKVQEIVFASTETFRNSLCTVTVIELPFIITARTESRQNTRWNGNS
jgi:hypothetical protein